MISVDSFRKITNPVFNDEHGLSINIICDIDGIGNDIPFTAMKNDCEEHGRVLYERALSGDYGSISKFGKKEQTQKLQTTLRTVGDLSIEAFSIQCAVDAGTASDAQIENLAELKEAIATRIGENREGIK